MLTTPIPGEAIRADLLREIIEELRASRVQPGPGILVQRGPSGTVVAAAEQEGGGSGRAAIMQDEVCLAVVTGGTAAAGYTVALFGDGLDAMRTGTGVLHVPECSAYSAMDLPEGTVLIAHATMVAQTGGSEA